MNLAAFILGLIWGFLRKLNLRGLFRPGFHWHALLGDLRIRLRSCFRKKFRWLPMLVTSVLIGALRASSLPARLADGAAWLPAVLVLLAAMQYLLMLLFLWRNMRKPGALLILAGTALNGLVILANGGRMPVRVVEQLFSPAVLERIAAAPHYMLATGTEPLFFLSDIIPFWTLGWYMISIGDLPIIAGIFCLAAYLPRRILRPGTKKVEETGAIGYTEGR